MKYAGTLFFLVFCWLVGAVPAWGGEKAIPPDYPACSFSVSTGPDITLCGPGQTVNLGASVSGPYLSAVWSPATGLSNPNSPNTSATVNQTTTYTLTVTGLGTENLIQNGDFSAGLTGFSSNYVPGTGGPWGILSNEGTFAVATNPNLTHTAFASCGDHTGGGNMLVVNGAGTPNQDVWCQTVNVTPNTNYAFGAWATSVVSNSPAILQISINGGLLGSPFTLPSATCQWTQFFQLWNSGGAVSATICIVNQNTQTGGNDFALDDIFFGPVCQETAQVTVQVVDLNANWAPPQGLCPFSPGFLLDALLAPGATPGGIWTINGVAGSFFNPLLLGPGSHTVSYSLSNPPCTANNPQQIVIQTLPSPEWAHPGVICVNAAPFALNSLLFPGTSPNGQWTVNGAPASIFQPAALGVGLHLVTYSLGIPPCDNSITQVVEIIPLPDPNWTPPPPLCVSAPAFALDNLLDAGATPGGAWSIAGNPVFIFDPATLGPGTYSVTYQVGAFPCIASSTQFITVNPLPVSAWNGPDSLCSTDASFNLNTWLLPGSTPGGTWTVNGQPASVLDPGALPPGAHLIVYTAGAPGCQSATSGSLFLQETPPAPAPFCSFITGNSIEIQWPPLAGVPSVQVLSGQTPSAATATSVSFQDLGVGESVQVLVQVVPDGPCPPVWSDTLTCVTFSCAALPVQIQPLDTVCLFPGAPPVSLQVAVPDSTGTGIWNGPGIADAATGDFQPALAGPGAHTVYYFYTLDNCAGIDSAVVVVAEQPVAAFTHDSTLCIAGTATITFSGTAGPSAVYNWDFGDAAIAGGSGAGPYALTWSSPGLRSIALVVEEGPCTSPPFTSEIRIIPQPEIPQVICNPGLTEVELTWNSLPDGNMLEAWVEEGPAGAFTSDTSFFIGGLIPGQAVRVRLTASTESECPDAEVIVDCTALTCAELSVDIMEPASVCLPSPAIALEAQIPGSGGVLLWSGPGIADAQSGLWAPDESMAGQLIPIAAHYSEGVCAASDTAWIAVFRQPSSKLLYFSQLCQYEADEIGYGGDASADATYTWDFGPGTATPGTGRGPHSLSFSEPGVYTVSLIVEENGCATAPMSVDIEVFPALEPPVITCEATYTSVTFSWSLAANAILENAVVLSGQSGGLVSNTSFMVSGLMPGEQVDLSLAISSVNGCTPLVDSAACSTLPCPDVSLAIEQPAQICLSGAVDTLRLNVQLDGAPASGALRWHGEGIADSIEGLWQSNNGMAGRSIWVHAEFADDVCVYADSVAIPVFATPDAAMQWDSVICSQDAALVFYTGNAGGSAVFVWDFGSATVQPGQGPGPHSLSFSSPGMYSVALEVEENGCRSLSNTAIIRVEPLLALPAPVCHADFSSMSFSWPAVAGASSYQVDLPAGVMPEWTSDTSILISNLLPSTSIAATVEALSATACPNTMATVECQTLACPPVNLGVQAQPVICAGDSARLQFSVSGPPDTRLDLLLGDGTNTWEVYDVSNGSSYAFLPAQTVQVSFLSALNASLPFCPVSLPGALSVTVESPSNAGLPLAPAMICAFADTAVQLSILLEGAGFGGAWSLAPGSATPAPGAFQPGPGVFNPRANPAGAFRFRYIVPAGAACPGDTALVSVELLPLPAADAGPDRVLDCHMSQLSIGTGGAPGLQYRWTTAGGSLLGDDMPMVEVDMPGLYRLEVINPATGCRAFDEVVVTSGITAPELTAALRQISCYGANDGLISVTSVTGGAAPVIFSLNGSEFTTQTVFPNLGPGIYDLVARDAGGCEDSLRFDLPQPVEVQAVIDPLGLASGDARVALGDSLHLQVLTTLDSADIASVVWTPAVCEGCLYVSLLPTHSTTYAVTVTNANGCAASAQLAITVDRRPAVFVPNAFSPNNDGLNDRLVIFSGKQVSHIRSFLIFDRWGEAVFEVYNFPPNDPSYAWDGKYRGRVLSPAVFVYFAEVVTIDGEVHLMKGDVTLMK